jgi:serine/threonine-protein kinase
LVASISRSEPKLSNFQPVPSTWVPLHAYDARAAWDGIDPAHPENKVHVEAAAFRGKLTYFETVYPWDQPLRQEQTEESGSSRALTFLLIAVFLVALIGSALLARKNVRLGRGDRRGAARIAVFYLSIRMLVWLFVEHHNGLPGREFTLFFLHLSDAVFTSFFLWLLYVALDPYVRRRWPHRIISWTRLLAGGYRDPLVGRDILIGAVFGVGMMLLTILVDASPHLLGRTAQIHIHPGVTSLGVHLFFEKFAVQVTAGLFQSFFALFLLLLFVIVLRRERWG